MSSSALLKRLLLVALFSTLAGCSTVSNWFEMDKDDGKQPAPLVDFDAEVKISKIWGSGVGSGQGDG